MVKKLELIDKDLVYVKALNILINDGNLKLHAIDPDDLPNVADTINWIRALHVRIARAPEEPSAAEIATKAEKVEPKPVVKRASRKKEAK